MAEVSEILLFIELFGIAISIIFSLYGVFKAQQSLEYSQETYYARFKPFLITRVDPSKKNNIFCVKNIGNGPAKDIKIWFTINTIELIEPTQPHALGKNDEYSFDINEIITNKDDIEIKYEYRDIANNTINPPKQIIVFK
ncbi:MAG: hypothetical protein GF308_07010 [Candidatus Heimdallarchaeota archaeon]|nr:hypothetical protein [Candidatus Heimdallarchaeota archaeon]